ncbi:MAG: ATP synthase F0 subunit C [Desulfatiglans sp.]|jgi:F-type H+-transporting ATPase subunit c|nr:ATP synthase F0 subunit C [Desulfatiglans sp.]
MSKKIMVTVMAFIAVSGLSSIAHAGENAAASAGLWAVALMAIACALAICIAASCTGIAMGYAINGAMQGVSRNPEAGGRIFTMLILGLALIESLCIYALLISLLMVFKIPALDATLEAIIKTIGG